MDHMPIFMNLTDRRALVIGGSQLASRKAALLLNACPQVEILADDPSPAMTRLIEAHNLVHHTGRFTPRLLNGIALVIAATDDGALNHAVYRVATARGLPVNVADQPPLCSFILPAIVDRAPVTVAVSTGGRSPVFARHVKALLERALPPGLGRAADWLARWRQPVRAAFDDEGARRRFWERIIDGPVGDLAHTDDAAADNAIAAELDQSESDAGHLRVIGVDPSDVDAISIAAHRALTRADLVVLEPEAGRDILQLCRREAAVRELPHAASAQWVAEQVTAGRRVALLRHHSALNHQHADTVIWQHANLDVRVLPAAPTRDPAARPRVIAA